MTRNDSSFTKAPNRMRGVALPIVLLFALLASWFAAEVLKVLSNSGTIVQDDYNYTRALYLAESGLNRAAEALWVAYLNSSAQPAGRMAWLDEHYMDFDQIDHPVGYGDWGGGQDKYTVRAVRIMQTGSPDSRYVVLESTGKAAGSRLGNLEEETERSITRVLKYGNDQSSIFDYVYFINNFGWFWGGTISAHGDVRANGDFSFKYNPLLNGDAYASINPDVGASGSVIDGGFHSWDLDTYRNNAQSQWRPTWPEFSYGYDGQSDVFEEQDILEMPYLGDFERFEELAEDRSGTLSAANVSISHSTGGPVFLIGTPENPIQIDGPVAIDGDVFITGYVDGQGTIYTSRNVHIVGDLIYTDPPSWDHSEGADPSATDNSESDFMGLAAKGSVIFGDYTNATDWYNLVKNYLSPPFTTTFTDEDGSTHSGDYREVDGTKMDGTDRKRYESTWDNATFQAMVQEAVDLCGHDHKPRQIDALIYTNHLCSGRVNSCKFNGAIMSRDEAIVFNNRIDLNYDYRAKAEAEDYIDIDLPRAANAEPVVWLDGDYETWASRLDEIDAGLHPN